MLNTIVELLKASGADAWEITEISERGWEFYCIRHALDQHRAKRLESFQVKVYKAFEDGKFLGSASASMAPDISREEAARMIADLLRDAVYVQNPAYTLNPSDGEAYAQSADIDLGAISRDFLQAMRTLPETVTEDLNSYEIFVSEMRRRYLNSNGIDVTAVYPVSQVEAVVNARDEGHEIELYRLYKSGSCDSAQLRQDLSELLRFGRDRLRTVTTPSLGQIDVVFSTDAAREIYDWFIYRLSAATIVRGISDWKPGVFVSEEMRGDRVTVETRQILPNSSANAAFDTEGAAVRDLTLIADGVVRASFGSRQYSQYLGLGDSFIASNFAVSGGGASAEELRQGRFLEIVEFSDFQVNVMNGDLGGEIRLGYLHEGDKVTPVSGGSISGTMRELVRTMRFSREQRQYDTRLIPAVTRLKDVTVTGAE
ncbi:MAG: TldD/PmbA family protein [Clostridia bacterium]|nr:TldD/PmbA family protein [Clostridia bacterium]